MKGMVKFKNPITAKVFVELHRDNIGDSLADYFIIQGSELTLKKGRGKLNEVKDVPIRYKEKYYNNRQNSFDTLYRIDFEGYDILICDTGVDKGDSEEVSFLPEHLFEME